MDANDHVIRLLDRGDNQMENDKIHEAIVNFKVANLLLKHFEDHTETALLIRCLKCLGDAYQSTGNQQEAKKLRRAAVNVKKKLKPKNLAQEDLVDDCASVVESVLQPQNALIEPQDFEDYDYGEDLLGENERLTEENNQVKEENSRLDIEVKQGKEMIKQQADEIEKLKAKISCLQLENDKLRAD